jgi:tripartite-type tricarboxylate transporter receptor subunit TctC
VIIHTSIKDYNSNSREKVSRNNTETICQRDVPLDRSRSRRHGPPKRLDGALAQVPTWREPGYAIVASNRRPVMAPRGLTAERIAYWEDVIQRFTQTNEWKDELAATGALSHYAGSRDLAVFLEAQGASCRAILTELGLAR